MRFLLVLVLVALAPPSFALLSHVAEAASKTVPHRAPRLVAPSLPSSPDVASETALAPSRKLDVASLVHEAERALLTGERPRVIPRALWDESSSTSSGLYAYRGDLRRRFTHVVVHHSDFDPAPGPDAILRYHKDVSGFSDIGYHFVIEPNGRVYEGRDLRFMGAHAGYTVEQRRAGRSKDPDFGAIGVVLDGNFESSRPEDRQLRAAIALIADLRRRFAIPRQNVIGHGEVSDHLVTQRGLTLGSSPTSCPGSELLKVLRGYRAVGDGALQVRAPAG